MKKILLFFLLSITFSSFGQTPPPPLGCDHFYTLDADNDGFTEFDLSDLRAFVALDAMHDFGWDLSGYDMILYPTELDYGQQTNAIMGDTYINMEAFSQHVNFEFVYNGNGPHLGSANLAYASCWILKTVAPDADTDGDGVPNGQEDRNGNGTLNDDDTNGDFIFNFLDPNDDGDALLTIEEDYNGNGNPADDDTNGNSIPDYLESGVVLGLAENNSFGFSVYPNPSHGNTTITFSGAEAGSVLTIFDISGKQIGNVRVSQSVEINGLEAGIYLLRFESQNQSAIKKLIVL